MDFNFVKVVDMGTLVTQKSFMETIGIINEIIAEYKKGNVVEFEPIMSTDGDEIAGYRLQSKWLRGMAITEVELYDLDEWFNDEDVYDILADSGHYGVDVDLILSVIEFLYDEVGVIASEDTTSVTVTIEGTSIFGENFKFSYDLSDCARLIR
jgi:hypothetical protein